MSLTFLGNTEYRHYVELGPAVTAVNVAEQFCKSGMVVVSPDTWQYCSKDRFKLEPMEDGEHMRVSILLEIVEQVRRGYFMYQCVSRKSLYQLFSEEVQSKAIS